MAQHVLIVGAGLGGLTLAQALRKNGIPFTIFERDESESSRTQGWALSIHSQAETDLRTSVPPDLPPLETVDVLYEHGIPAEFAVFQTRDGQLHEVARMGPRHGVPMIRANRAKLRRHLQTNIEVQWDKRFERYEEDDGGVTAYFTDGTTYRGTCLVGADGINSSVRTQLFAGRHDVTPQHIPMGVVIGELTATPEQYERWMKVATSFFPVYAEARRVTIALKSMAADKSSAEYYWLFNWDDETATSENYWTKAATKQELHGFVMNKLDGLALEIVEILRATPVEGIVHPPLQLRQMVPPGIPHGRITLLGDAVHPMTPFRGQGANMAMSDGLSIAKALADQIDRPIAASFKAYEAEMTPRATKAVLDSSEGRKDH